MIRVRQYPSGPRCWVCGVRVHHGTVGTLLVVAGMILAAHDRADWRVWFNIKRGGPTA